MAEHLAGHGFHTSAATARLLPAAGGRLLAGAAGTGGHFTLIEAAVPGGDSTPLHRHMVMDESFYLLVGSLTVTCGDDVFEPGTGDFVHLPRGIPHRYVAGPEGAQMLILAAPGGLEGFFDDWAAEMDSGELAQKHNIEFSG